MQKQKKLSARILSIVLTVAMVGTLLPTTVFAAEGDTPAVTSGTTTTPRTTSLDLKATSLSYVPSGGGTPKTADPTTTSITDTGEGWSWNLDTKTLTLSGATITNTETATPTTPETPNGLVCYFSCGMILPSGSTIELTENTENTITGGNVDTSSDLTTGDILLESAGVCVEETGGDGKTTLTIQGKGTLNAMGGTLTTGDAVNTSRRSTYSYGITSSDSLNIKGGTVNATGGDATVNSNYPQVASYGINAWYDITAADAANVTATGGYAKGTFKVNRSGYADGFANSYGLDAGGNIVITDSTVNARGGATENTNVDETSTVEGDSGSTGISSGSSTTINGATVTSHAVYTGIETTENLTISNGSTVVAEGTYFGIAAQTALSIEDSTVTASGLDESGILGFGISSPAISINSGHVIAQGTILAMACLGEDSPETGTITIADSATIVGSEENDGIPSAAKIGTAAIEIMETQLTLPCMVLTNTQAGAKDVDISFESAVNTAVSFDARNGKPDASVEIKDGMSTITMPADPTWGNYTFAGWWTDIDGKGTAFANSGLTASTTVYAKWTKDGKTVRTTPLDLRDISSTTNSKEGWAWDSTNKTLTLSGAQIFGTGEGYGIMLPTKSKIVLSEGTTSNVTGGSELCLLVNAGSNSLYGSCGIFCETVIVDRPPAADDGKLTITGTGKLVATGGDLSACTSDVAQVSSGIGSTIHITVEDADVTATGGRLSPYTNTDTEWALMSAGMFALGGIVEINGAAKVIATGADCDTYRDSFGIHGTVTIQDSADVTAIAGKGGTSKGIDSGEMTMTGGTLSASGEVAISARPITAAGATVTNGTADNEGGKFVSGTTNTLTQTDATQPVVIKFTNSVTFDARNGVAIKDADIDKDKGTITAMPTAPTWEGYKFEGWYTGIDGAGTEFVNSGLTANTTVYAKWTATNGKTVRTTPLDLLADSVTPAADQGWTWADNTLTLSGATIDCSGNPAVAEGASFGIQLMNNYDIVLTNGTTNTVKAGDSSSYMSIGVYFMGGFRSVESSSISGKGTLYATGGKAGPDEAGGVGIMCEGATPLTFSDATMIATSTKAEKAIGIDAPLDVKSGTITATGTGTLLGAGINASSMIMSGGTVTAIGKSDTTDEEYGIVGGNLEMTGGTLSASGKITVFMEDGAITAAKATVTGATEPFESGTTASLTQNGTDPVVISFIPKISFDARNGAPSENAEISEGGTITMPADPKWGDYTFDGWYTEMDGAGTKFENNGLTVSNTVYANWTKDGKSVRTTPLDFTNATTNLEGDGWMWDNDSKTLTLSGLTLNSAKLDNNSDAVGIKFPTGPCTIILVDGTENAVDVSLAQNSTDSWGIFAPGQLTIKTSGNGTPGKLNAIAGNTSGVSVGIYAGGGIVIESGNITATAGSSESDNSIGISADSGNIHIKGGTVNATGGKSGATGMAGSFGLYGANVQIDNGAVTATGGEAALSAGIVGGAYVNLNGGTINAKGTTAAVAALTEDVVIGGGIANVKVNDESATIAKKTIGEMTISTLLTTEAAIITDAAIKFKPNYTGTNPLAANPFKAIRTHSSITLPSQTITGETVEYGIKNSGGTIVWQDSPTFSGLNPDTKYEFYTRVKGNDTHKAGTTSDPTTIKTRKVPTTVSGNVTDSKGAAVSGATVTLTPSDPALKTTTDASGNYIISNVPEGVYSLIITKDDLTITETVTVDGTAVEGKNITLLAGTKNTVVESTAGTPEISAGDVNELLNDTNIGTTLTEPEKDLVETNGGSVEIKVKADMKTGDQLAADKSQIEDIAGNQKIDLLLDFSVLKTVKDSSGNTVTDGEKITKLANIIKIRLPIPADLQGKADLSLYRIHDGKPEKLSTSPDSNGEYYTIDPSGEFMTLYLKNFSTYALGYNAFTLTIVDGGTGVSGKGNYANGDIVTINAGSKGGYSFNGWTVTTGTVTLANPSNASTIFTMPGENVTLTAGWTYTGGGGGGGGTTTYPNSVNKPENGTVSMNPASPSKGQTVTITTKPDDGYVVKTIIVKDADGKTIAVTEKGENSYTFTQPKGKVTLAVTYAKAGDIYTDMLPTDWFYDAVTKATVNGWFKGTSDTTFSPYASTGRGMIATILHRMEGAPQANTTSFSDVAADAYYANAIAWAQAYNIVSGYGNGTYGPNDNVTREQLATILYRYATYKGYDVSKTAAFDSFADSKSVSAYAKEAMSWAVGNGLISGRDNNTLTPTETATRAELAVILVRFAELSK